MGWWGRERNAQAVLLGSEEAGALSSRELPVVVLMRLLSQRARDQGAAFWEEPIYLGLPVGAFL